MYKRAQLNLWDNVHWVKETMVTTDKDLQWSYYE